MTILITGCAGFIGMHVTHALLNKGEKLVGLDNLSDYYDPNLKIQRLNQLKKHKNFKFIKADINNKNIIDKIFNIHRPKMVLHLAAQPGVRYSLINPAIYINTNINGFFNVVDNCRLYEVDHFVYASSSSVYGLNAKMPFSTDDSTDHPQSLYAATKKANELLAHSYSHLHQLPCTGLRFFTVYGPWGRPDMSPWLFANAIAENKPIKVYNHGKMLRDFTYIDDITNGVVNALFKIPKHDSKFTTHKPNPGSSNSPYRIYNIGGSSPVELMLFINLLEKRMGKIAEKIFLPMQNGDVIATYANIDRSTMDIDYEPKISIHEGIDRWIHWFQSYLDEQ